MVDGASAVKVTDSQTVPWPAPVSAKITCVDSRWDLAHQLCRKVLGRYGPDVHAIGVHGPLAHGDDHPGSGIALVVVMEEPGLGPRPCARRVQGTVVELEVTSAEEYLGRARSLRVDWPLAADRYLTTRPLYDPVGWHDRLRAAHLERLAAASEAEFLALARDALAAAIVLTEQADHLAGSGAPGARVALVEAVTATAVVEGLITRTYFRDRTDAVVRTGLAGAGLPDVRAAQRDQLDRLAATGYPLDASLDALVAA